MRSPFPGMDPYIEGCGLWEDFHNHLIERIYEAVSAALPKGYLARTGKRSYVVLAETEGKQDHSFQPDLSVTSPSRRRRGSAETSVRGVTSGAAEAEPVSMRAFIETEYHERFMDIYELQPERRLVTSIEVLSPSNKRRGTRGWKKYLRKRQALLLGRANLVEVDLLRDGCRLPMLDPWPASPYAILVAREEQAPDCRVWPAFCHCPLPAVPVPLRRPDPDILLALQPLLDAIYERARYQEEIDYAKALVPPLSSEEAAWVKTHLGAGESPTKPASARPPRKRRS